MSFFSLMHFWPCPVPSGGYSLISLHAYLKKIFLRKWIYIPNHENQYYISGAPFYPFCLSRNTVSDVSYELWWICFLNGKNHIPVWVDPGCGPLAPRIHIYNNCRENCVCPTIVIICQCPSPLLNKTNKYYPISPPWVTF